MGAAAATNTHAHAYLVEQVRLGNALELAARLACARDRHRGGRFTGCEGGGAGTRPVRLPVQAHTQCLCVPVLDVDSGVVEICVDQRVHVELEFSLRFGRKNVVVGIVELVQEHLLFPTPGVGRGARNDVLD